MPTDNPKISLYVPQQIYDRFKEFQEEQNLSMSQAGIVILAEYFGLEETIKEITEGTTIGGVTLAEFRQLKQRVGTLENQVSLNQKILDEQAKVSTEYQTKIINDSPVESKNINKTEQVNFNKTTSSLPKKVVEDSKLQLSLSSEPSDISPIPASHLCTKRFGLGKDTMASYKRKHSPEELTTWTKEKDPDNIGWVISPDNKGYVPESSLPDELLNKLKKWITDNL